MQTERDKRGRLRGVVICDASGRSARTAAVACVGALGTHTQVIDTGESVLAEARAVLFAMDIALATGGSPQRFVFLTDCEPLVAAKWLLSGEQADLINRIRRRLARWQQWELRCVPREQTQEAHVVARAARRRGRLAA